MTIRVSAGALVVREGNLLLVRMGLGDESHFWIPPGGGMEAGEGAFSCAERETLEETGLVVKARRLAYVQELLGSKHHHVKLWVHCTAEEGEPHLSNRMAAEIFELHEARFVSQDELSTMQTVPFISDTEFWSDLSAGFLDTKYLGVNKARFP